MITRIPPKSIFFSIPPKTTGKLEVKSQTGGKYSPVMCFTEAFLQISDLKREARAGAVGCDWQVWGGWDRMLRTEKKAMRSDGRQKTVRKGRSLSGCDQVLCYWLIGKCRLTLHKTVLPHNTINKMDSVTRWLCSWVATSAIANRSINSNDHLENWSLFSYKIQFRACT